MKPEIPSRPGWRRVGGGVCAALGLLSLGSCLESGVQGREEPWSKGVLGIRAVAADFVWIAVQAAWERQDPVATTAAIRRAAALDPGRLTFWINGARMIAYDLPTWRIAAAGGAEVIPAPVERHWRGEQALLALAHLEEARVVHPDDVNLLIEQANIELWARGNIAGAADAFGRAASMPAAPEYALRLQVTLLLRSGRVDEARRALQVGRAAVTEAHGTANSTQQRWIEASLVSLGGEL